MRDKTCSKKGDKGFSLIELIIAIAILLILSGTLTLGTNTSREKETDKYVNELANQIRMTQITAMAKAGKWRLALYMKEGDYYCVMELAKETEDTSEALDWQGQSKPVMLGHSEALNYKVNSEAEAGRSSEAEGEPIHVWRFNSDTGSCMEGAGTMTVTGIGRTKYLTVYRENGRCEVLDGR